MGTVYIKKCNKYNLNKVKEIINEYFKNNLKHKIKAGSKILIKPNLVRAIEKENAATTHPVVIEAVIQILHEMNAIVIIAESPGGPYNYNRLRTVYKKTGILDLSLKYGCILNYDLSSVNIKNENAKRLKNIKVIKPIIECDYVINIAKLKTHMMMTYTGAVKNMFGIIPGTEKANYHMRFYEYDEFADSIIDIYNFRKPDLNIIDAIESMEGKGPTSGKKKNTKFILLSENGYDIDYVATKIVKIDYLKVPILKQALERGFLDKEKIQIEGDAIEELEVDNFLLADKERGIKGFLYDKVFVKYIAKKIRPLPYINKLKCRNCGICVESCPVKSIEAGNKYPNINHDKCIRCFCCHELCPNKAIKIKKLKLKN